MRGKYYFRLLSLAPELSGLAVDTRKRGVSQYNTSMQAIDRTKDNNSPFERSIGQYWRVEATDVWLNGKRGYRILYDLDGQTRALTSDQNGSGPFLTPPQNNDFQFWLLEQASDGAVSILNYGLLKRNSLVAQLFADINTKEVIVDKVSKHSNAVWNFATLVAKDATNTANPFTAFNRITSPNGQQELCARVKFISGNNSFDLKTCDARDNWGDKVEVVKHFNGQDFMLKVHSNQGAVFISADGVDFPDPNNPVGPAIDSNYYSWQFQQVGNNRYVFTNLRSGKALTRTMWGLVMDNVSNAESQQWSFITRQ